MMKFAVPCVLSLLVSSLYNIVDQVFIGWGVGYLGNGATNVVFPITIIALALMIGDGCADYVLRDRPNLLLLFVMDDIDRRIRHVSQRDQITPAQAEQKIRKMEKMRAAYYNSRTDSKWGAAENYDLCLNISRISRERVLHIILDQVRDKK